MAAWILNLDSDYELAQGSSYQPRRVVVEAMKAHVERLAGRLLGPDDVLVTNGVRAAGMIGRAWSPTPRALAALERAGATPASHPTQDTLRRVTSRAFAASLGQTLQNATFVGTYEDAVAAIARPGTWRLKRAFGMAGREHRIVKSGAASDADLGFVRASIAEGGVQIEPQLEIVRELAIHGYIEEDGTARLGPLFEQRTDSRGAWIESIETPDIAAIRQEGERSARALHAAGYFGPFGQDAFEHVNGLQTRSELNARYTMGYPRDLVPR